MLRVVEDVVERALLDDPSRVHDDHAVGDVGHDAQVVGDQDHPGAGLVAQLAQLVEDLRLDRHVERRRRLVGDQQLRRARERHRDHHALAHAARELVRIRAQPLAGARDPDALHQLDRAIERLRLGDLAIVRADLLDDLMADPVDRVERAHRVLEHHRDPGATDPLQLLCARLDELGAVELARSPRTWRSGPRVSPIRVIAVTDLPEPDSPTIETISPGETENETPSTACTTPSSVANETLSSETSSSGDASAVVMPRA